MPDDPGVTTWTTTRLQLINALRDRKVLASTPVLEGDEALAALADAILACLPEAGDGPEKALANAERIIQEKDAELAGLRDPGSVTVRREDLRALLDEGFVNPGVLSRLTVAAEATP